MKCPKCGSEMVLFDETETMVIYRCPSCRPEDVYIQELKEVKKPKSKKKETKKEKKKEEEE